MKARPLIHWPGVPSWRAFTPFLVACAVAWTLEVTALGALPAARAAMLRAGIYLWLGALAAWCELGASSRAGMERELHRTGSMSIHALSLVSAGLLFMAWVFGGLAQALAVAELAPEDVPWPRPWARPALLASGLAGVFATALTGRLRALRSGDAPVGVRAELSSIAPAFIAGAASLLFGALASDESASPPFDQRLAGFALFALPALACFITLAALARRHGTDVFPIRALRAERAALRGPLRK